MIAIIIAVRFFYFLDGYLDLYIDEEGQVIYGFTWQNFRVVFFDIRPIYPHIGRPPYQRGYYTPWELGHFWKNWVVLIFKNYSEMSGAISRNLLNRMFWNRSMLCMGVSGTCHTIFRTIQSELTKLRSENPPGEGEKPGLSVKNRASEGYTPWRRLRLPRLNVEVKSA